MESLKKFNDFVKKITACGSRSYKLSVLKEEEENSVVKYFLKYVFDPFITTGLSKKKLSKELPALSGFDNSIQLLEWLKVNNTGTNEAISFIAGFKSKLDLELSFLLDQIICKNLPLGVEALTINRVMPNLISTFNVQLANKYFDKPEVVEGKELSLTTKIDGGRIIAIKKDGVVSFYTRAGQKYEGLVDLEKEMLEKMPDNIALDGEITLLHSEGLNNKEQYKQTMMITRRLGEKHGVKMKVFDAMLADNFIRQRSQLVYTDRRSLLEEIFNSSDYEFFELLPVLYHGTDCSMIMKVLDEQVKKGEEGIMININEEPYCFGRSNALLKVKKMRDIDLEVIGLEEGTNQNAGKLGAFVVDYKGNKVRVGSGISKELREKVWANREDYLGLTISVQYFEETKNQAGGMSLRFPVFLDFRYDK